MGDTMNAGHYEKGRATRLREITPHKSMQQASAKSFMKEHSPLAYFHETMTHMYDVKY